MAKNNCTSYTRCSPVQLFYAFVKMLARSAKKDNATLKLLILTFYINVMLFKESRVWVDVFRDSENPLIVSSLIPNPPQKKFKTILETKQHPVITNTYSLLALTFLIIKGKDLDYFVALIWHISHSFPHSTTVPCQKAACTVDPLMSVIASPAAGQCFQACHLDFGSMSRTASQ